MNCPICDAPTRRLFKKYGYWIRVCETCFHQFAELTPTLAHGEQVYGDEYFDVEVDEKSGDYSTPSDDLAEIVEDV